MALELIPWLLVAPCLFWFLPLVFGARVFAGLGRLRPAAVPPTQAPWPRLSVVIPACNEAGTIEAALTTLLDQTYPDLELVVIDDRSTDETGAIIDRLAGRDPRVRPVHLTELPSGWLGKLHAMHAGTKAASGEWILFTDADVHYAPGALELAMNAAIEDHLDHLSLIPAMRAGGPLLMAAMIAFGAGFLLVLEPSKVKDPSSPTAIGVGAFNLVRRSAFDRTPGFEWLKMEIADDVGLARMMKSHGARTDFRLAREVLSLTWYESAGTMIRGLEKNLFAVIGQFQTMRALAVLALGALVTVAPLVALALGGGLALVGAAALLAIGGVGLVTARFLGLPLWVAVLGPVGLFVLGLALSLSMIRTLRAGGVRWRDTFYPIDELRRGQRVRL